MVQQLCWNCKAHQYLLQTVLSDQQYCFKVFLPLLGIKLRKQTHTLSIYFSDPIPLYCGAHRTSGLLAVLLVKEGTLLLDFFPLPPTALPVLMLCGVSV